MHRRNFNASRNAGFVAAVSALAGVEAVVEVEMISGEKSDMSFASEPRYSVCSRIGFIPTGTVPLME